MPRLEPIRSHPLVGLLAALLLLGLVGPPRHVSAASPQQAGSPDTIRAGAEAVDPILRGLLLLDTLPADTGTAVLHRVTPEEAGPVDSIRVVGEGRFEFRLPALPVPGSGEIYFVSARYEGILYFGPPITEPGQLDSLYTVTKHSTRRAPLEGVPLTVEVRNLFIDQGPMGWRATDLFQVRNDSAFTWIADGEAGIVWAYPLLTGARSFRVGQSDLAPDAVRFEGGSLQVRSPLPPGERLFIVQYELDELDFSLPLPGHTEVLELLVEDGAPSLRVDGLAAAQPVEMEPGSVYLRWAGEDISDRSVRVEPGEEGGAGILPLAAIGLALLLLAVGAWALRRPEDGLPDDDPRGGTREPRSREAILLEVANLDEAFEAMEEPDRTERAEYEARRRALLEELEALKGGGRATVGRRAVEATGDSEGRGPDEEGELR